MPAGSFKHGQITLNKALLCRTETPIEVFADYLLICPDFVTLYLKPSVEVEMSLATVKLSIVEYANTSTKHLSYT